MLSCLLLSILKKLTSLVLALTFSRNNDISRDTIEGWIEMAKNGEVAKLNKDSMCKTFSSPMLKKLYVINKLFMKTVSVEKTRTICPFSQVYS